MAHARWIADGVGDESERVGVSVLKGPTSHSVGPHPEMIVKERPARFSQNRRKLVISIMSMTKSTLPKRELPVFSTLLEHHGKELHAYLWRLLQDQHEAEDCLQETFLRAFRAYDRTSPDSNYRAWLYRIATNVARTSLQKSQRHDRHHLLDLDRDEADPLDILSRKEQVARVVSELERLSFRQRTAIIMRKYNDLSYQVIAEALGCSSETARAHVYQGLQRLRKRMRSGDEVAGDYDE